jgi:hypothetical protein
MTRFRGSSGLELAIFEKQLSFVNQTRHLRVISFCEYQLLQGAKHTGGFYGAEHV